MNIRLFLRMNIRNNQGFVIIKGTSIQAEGADVNGLCSA